MRRSIPERIPKALAEAPIWTVSGAKKIPQDPYALINENRKKGYSPKTGRLMPLDNIWSYLEDMKNDELKAAMQISSDTPFVVVDIEPEGMISGNPYFSWPYIYLEYSRNYGMHGILPFDPPEEYAYLKDKFMIKDPVWETEVLVGNGHFATFTFNEQELNQYDERVLFSHTPEFQRHLAEHLASKTKKKRPIDPDAAIQMEPGQFKDLTRQPLGSYDQSIIRDILKTTEVLHLEPTDDASQKENSMILKLYNAMIYKDRMYLAESALESRTIPVLWTLAQGRIPTRQKHASLRDSTDYGEVPWFGYVILDVIEYARNSALDDTNRAHWVKK